MRKLVLLLIVLPLLLCSCAAPTPTPAPVETAAPTVTETKLPVNTPVQTAQPETPPVETPVGEMLKITAADGKITEVGAYELTREIDGAELRISVCRDDFTVHELDDGFRIQHSGEDEAYLELRFEPQADSEKLLPNFIDAYIEFTDIEFASYKKLGRSGINADTVLASNSELTAQGYIAQLDGGSLCTALVCARSAEEVLPYLSAMLDTVILEK